MIENQKSPIKKLVPGRRDPTCFELRHAIILPAGTILRQHVGQDGTFTAPLAFGTFTIEGPAAAEHPESFKKVVA